jgi:hypothetical protein
MSGPPSSGGGYSSYESGNDLPRGNYGRNDNGFDSNNLPGPDMRDFDFVPMRPMPVYFPPYAPRLYAHVDLPNLNEARKPAPAELAAYINEPFYAPLSTRLAEKTLSSRQRQRVEAYLAAKIRLQNELRSRLSALRNTDSATRQQEIAALARVEDPQIDELEQTAEQLRIDLIRGEIFQANVDWNESREWRLGESRFSTTVDAISAQFQVMQSATFYQKGFIPSQRRLLREVAMELGELPVSPPETAEQSADVVAAPTDANPLLFFSPETARVRLPAELPQELADKISRYEREKSALKKELRDVVYQEDTAYFSFVRSHAAAILAQQQAGRIAALEVLAEEIRRGLAALPNQPQPPGRPDTPPMIVDRIDQFLQEKLAVQKDLLQLLHEARNNIEIDRVASVRGADGKFTLSISVSPFGRDEAKMRKVQADFAAFSQRSATQSVVLKNELLSLRRDVASLIAGPSGVASEKAIDRYLTDTADVIEEGKDWRLYDDYRIAVLEPGLSPEQRRLLFDASVVDLDLPLPGLQHSPVHPGGGRRSFSANAPSPYMTPSLVAAPRGR